MEFVICQNQTHNQEDVLAEIASPTEEAGLPSIDSIVTKQTLSVPGGSAIEDDDEIEEQVGTPALRSMSKRAPSPLVMSEFMGISSMMKDGATLINPWNLGVSFPTHHLPINTDNVG